MIVFDLDGTLSIVGDRANELKKDPPDWDRFYARCDEDLPNRPIMMLYRAFVWRNLDVRIVTGRRESERQKTIDWFASHGIWIRSSTDIFMRPDGDHRHDTILKPELVAKFLGDIEVVFEDRNSMVKKWRELGITCCQVAEGDF